MLITVLTGQQALLGLGLIVTGILAMVKFFFTYPTELFPLMTISSLFKHIKVSGIRPVPCTLKGNIAGGSRAVPLHADTFAMRDYTGITLLEYPQPLRIWEFLFRVFRSEETPAEEVTLEGWYRRSPVPYIEIKSISAQGSVRACHAYTLRKFMILLAILVGFVLAFVPIETLLPFL
jgi:heat shock protein HtpX